MNIKCYIRYRQILLTFMLILLTVMLSANAHEIPPVLVKVTLVKRQAMPTWLVAHGTLYAKNDAKLSSITGGVIRNITFKPGDFVKQGQILFILDDKSQQAKLERAQAETRLAKLALMRSRETFKQHATAQQALDIAEANFETSRADQSLAEAELAKRHIAAPFNGKLSVSHVSVGDYVAPGTKLVEIIAPNELRVQFSIAEKFVRHVSRGQLLLLNSDIYPHESFQAKVDYIAPTVDEATKTINIEGALQSAKKALFPGGSVAIMLLIKMNPKALVIPEAALINAIAGRSVFKVINGATKGKQIVRKVAVQVGSIKDGLAEIKTGLDADDVVVIEGQQKLHDGQAITMENVQEHALSTGG